MYIIHNEYLIETKIKLQDILKGSNNCKFNISTPEVDGISTISSDYEYGGYVRFMVL